MDIDVLAPSNGHKKTGISKGYSQKPITESITNGFFAVDRKWTVKHWNTAAEKLLGVSAKDIIGKNLWEQFAETIPLDFYMFYHKAFQKDTPCHFREYWAEMDTWYDVITYYSDETLSVSFKETSQPTKPEYIWQQLQIQNELYRFVTGITNDCLWEWSIPAKEIFWIDGGHKRVFGYHIENALVPQSFWEDLIHPEDKMRVLSKLNRTLAEGTADTWEEEYRFKKMDGGYAYVHDRGHIIYDKDGTPTRMVGATLDITEKSLLEKKLVAERLTRQREITDAVLVAQEKEREYIGRELHDNLNQVLAVAKLYVQMSRTYDSHRDEHIDKSISLITEVIEDIRKIAKNLVIPGAHIIGIVDNIKNLVRDLKAIDPIEIEFHAENIWEEKLNEKLQLTIFRIVQEQINNILKHADAGHVDIKLSQQENEISLIIIDDGKGCDLSKDIKGVGVINIKSRVELYNGRVSIMTKPGEGYRLEVRLPADLI